MLSKSKRFGKQVGFANVTFFLLLGYALSIKYSHAKLRLFKQQEEHEVPYYKWQIFHRVKPTETVFERPY